MFFLSESSFIHPSYSGYSEWLRFAPAVSWIVDVVRPGSVVELGAGDCVSYFTILQALGELLPKTSAAVRRSGEATADDPGWRAAIVYNRERYPGTSKLLCASADDALLGFPASSIDLLHLADELAVAEARSLLEAHDSQLSPRAVILLTGFAVSASARLLPGWESAVVAPGLAVFWRSPNAALESLRQITLGDTGELVGRLYEHLGELLLQRRAANQLTKQMEELQKAMGELERLELQKREMILDELTEQVADVRSDLEQSHRVEMARLQAKLRKCQADVALFKGSFDAVISSKSWRVTEPIRAALRALDVLRNRREPAPRGKT